MAGIGLRILVHGVVFYVFSCKLVLGLTSNFFQPQAQLAK
jgi:hypothetical protein